MNKFARFLLILALLLALAASLYIVFIPITYTQLDAVTGQETTGQISWFEGQGWWGILILLLFTALYAVPWLLYQRGRSWWAVAAVVLALVLTYMAGFSIGIVYWPAATALILATLVIIFKKT